MTRPVVALCIVGAALAAVLGGAEATRADGRTRYSAPATEQVPVESTDLVCPRTAASTGATNRLALVAPAHIGDGIAEVRSRDPLKPLPPLRLSAGGTAAVVEPRLVAVEPIVAAQGSLASGVVADAALRVDDGPFRGIYGGRCVAPATQFWFAGASTKAGRIALLTLTNLDPLPATVDVVIYSVKGVVDAPPGRGLTIPPGTAKTIALDTLAPDENYLLVHVEAKAGRVGAFLLQRIAYAGTPGGVDYIPPVDAPALSSVVPGLPNGTGYRRVVLANPGEDDATAKLTLITSDGSFVPDGLDAVTVSAGSTREVDVTGPLAQQAAALQVDADQPLVVSSMADTGPRLRRIGEFAFTAAVPPLDGPTPVGITTIGRAQSTIFLSAPRGGGTVLVTTLAVGGGTAAPARRVVVPQGRTVSVDLPPQQDTPYSVVLEQVSGSGPIYAARELLELGARGPLYTIEPVRSGRGTALLRPVVADVTAGLPR